MLFRLKVYIFAGNKNKTMKTRILTIIIALLCSFSCLVEAQKSGELLRKGVDLSEEANFNAAMQYFTRSLELAEKERDTLTIMQSIGYIGNIYFNIYDYTRAARYMLKGYAMAEDCGDKELQSAFLTNLVGVYCKMHDKQEAQRYYKLLAACPSTKDYATYRYYLLYNRARLYNVEGNPTMAIDYHKKAYQWAIDKRLGTANELFQLCEIGEIYLAEGKCDEAIAYGRRCENPARENNELDLLTSVYKLMADAYELKGDTKGTDNYRQLYFALSDSLFNRNKISSADKELDEYELRQTVYHINSLNNVITRQIVAIVAISAVVAILLALSVTLYRYNRKLKMAHRTLIEKNDELTKADRDRQEMLQQWVDEADGNDEQARKNTALNQEQSKRLLAKIMTVMDDEGVIANPEFSLNMLADSVESNTKYVSQVINDNYGKNFKTLLNERRIRQACLRLSDTTHYGKLTIQAIYEEVGYTNAVSFIRAFKKVNGMTPSEYQKCLAQQ